jgi:hypothetical protein
MPPSRIQFRIGSLMVAVALAACLFAAAHSGVALATAFGSLYVALIGALLSMFRGLRHLSALSFGIAAASYTTLSALLCVYRPDVGGAFVMIICQLCTFPVVVGAGVAWASVATRRTGKSRRSPLLAWPLVVLFAILPPSMVVGFWPLRLAFLVSRPALERLADRVAAGADVAGPEWVGMFVVFGSEVDPVTGNVGLIVNPDPSGRSGFLRINPSPSTPTGRSIGPFRDIYLDLQLRDRWWYECED